MLVCFVLRTSNIKHLVFQLHASYVHAHPSSGPSLLNLVTVDDISFSQPALSDEGVYRRGRKPCFDQKPVGATSVVERAQHIIVPISDPLVHRGGIQIWQHTYLGNPCSNLVYMWQVPLRLATPTQVFACSIHPTTPFGTCILHDLISFSPCALSRVPRGKQRQPSGRLSAWASHCIFPNCSVWASNAN